MADIFAVIADPTRRELLHALLDRYAESTDGSGELSVGQLVDKLGLSQPTVSKHLRMLRDAALVQVREEGQHRYYRLDAAPLEAVEEWIIPFVGSHLDSVDDADIAVFTAWSGERLPAPFRRVADRLDHPAVAGETVGRAVAGATFSVRSVVAGVTSAIRERVVEPIRGRIGR